MVRRRQDPYLVQIGFDYGTSYSKCVCRDLIVDKAWVHIPQAYRTAKIPFLIPSSICYEQGRFVINPSHDVHYPEKGLFHLKLALEKVARQEYADPVLDQYKAACRSADPARLGGFVMNASTFLLASALAGVRQGLVVRFGDFGAHADDTAYVNMAIPVADASSPVVSEAFGMVLRRAWSIASRAGALEHLASREGQAAAIGALAHSQAAGGFEPTYIYPEVSAGVQGFVRSRSASPGTYMFTDTGAGTVDQSTFVFRRDNGREWLTYLNARVLPAGSSQLEIRAACKAGGIDPTTLEALRVRKEKGLDSAELLAARREIAAEVGLGTYLSLGQSKRKIHCERDLAEAGLLFGGGGHCRDPYEIAVKGKFGRPWFDPKYTPRVVGMPSPKDLELGANQSTWFARLYVAYGLSFFRNDLAGHTFPEDLPDVPPVYPPDVPFGGRQITHERFRPAPTKDEC